MKKIVLTGILLCCVIALSAQTYTISTLTKPVWAGHGFSGDGGPDTLATLSNPQGIAVDNKGNIYIADYSNARVRKIDTNGIITTFAGSAASGYAGDNGPATAAELSGPMRVACDDSGNVFITDNDYSVVRKVNTNGIITTYAGPPDFTAPYGIACDDSGNVFVSDDDYEILYKINSKGVISTIAGKYHIAGDSGDGGPATAALLNDPFAVTLDDSGNVYVIDNVEDDVRKINTKGIISHIAGGTSIGYDGDSIAADTAWTNATGLVTDKNGNMFLADENNGRVRMINKSGIIYTIAGTGDATKHNGDGGPATAASVGAPIDIAIDKQGNLYFVEGNFACVRKLTLNSLTGVNEISSNNSMTVFPNPFSTTSSIVFNTNGKHYIELDDVTGRKIESMQCTGKQYELNRSGLAAGVYFVRAYDEGMKYVATAKVVVQ
jgi:streptogramin lyase